MLSRLAPALFLLSPRPRPAAQITLASRSRFDDPPSVWRKKAESNSEPESPEWSGLVAGLGGAAKAAAIVVSLGLFLVYGGSYRRTPPALPGLTSTQALDSRKSAFCSPVTRSGQPVVVSMLYSADKQGWIEDAAQRFAKLCPTIQVQLKAMADLKAVRAILDGEERPTLWSPTDVVIVRYLESLWQARSNTTLFNDGPHPSLVWSPLVLLVHEERALALEALLRAGTSQKDGREGMWTQTMCPLVPRNPDLTMMRRGELVPGRWLDWYDATFPTAALKRSQAADSAADDPHLDRAKLASWGRVKLTHPSPTMSTAGLEALYLMAYDYLLLPDTRNLDAPAAQTEALSGSRVRMSEQLRDAFASAFVQREAALLRWLSRCEAGLDKAAPSAWGLTQELFYQSSEKYDGVVTFEHLALKVLAPLDKHADGLPQLRVLYPEPTFANRHPVLILHPDQPDRAEQREAADKWIKFLRSTEMQKRAIEFGFRPSVSDLSIRDYDSAHNLFPSMRRHGILFDLNLVEPPSLSGVTLRALVKAWEDATGQR